jgi:tetratricopeptide (TPR) repeat protein
MLLNHNAQRVYIQCVFLIAFAVPANAQFTSAFGGAESATVRGAVQNVPIGHGLLVELDGASGSYGSYRTEIGQQGAFMFMAVPQGHYILKVVDRYGTVIQREFVEVNRMMAPVNLRLPERKREDAKPGTISIQRLAHKVPKNARKEFERAEEAAQDGEMAKSVVHLRKAVEIDPEYFEALVNLGARLLRQNQPAEALSFFEKALRVDENSSILLSNTATALLMLNRAAEAERAARTSAELNPLNARARYMLGLALLQQNKDIPEALENLQRISQEFPYARVALAQAFTAQGRKDRAAGELQAYLDSGRPENREKVETWLASLKR